MIAVAIILSFLTGLIVGRRAAMLRADKAVALEREMTAQDDAIRLSRQYEWRKDVRVHRKRRELMKPRGAGGGHGGDAA